MTSAPRRVRRLVVRVAVVAACAVCTACGDPPTPPDVVLVVVDTLRQDHVGCYGHARNTTPNIDALADVGVRFDRAYSQAPWTTPSFASMLSSHYPSTLGVTDKPDRLDDRFTMLPEVLAAHGYATGAVISHYFLKTKWNLSQGFESYDESSIVGHRNVSGHTTTGAALDFVDRHPDRPYFLLVHYFDPHYDYIEHRDHRYSTGLDYDGPITSGMLYPDLKEIVATLEDVDLDYLRRLYDSEIAFTDARIGELLDGLRTRGRFDNAVVVVTADHGEEFRERRTVGHGGTVYNELIKVPLIVKLPGPSSAGVVSTSVGLIDLYPTILEIVGVPIEHEIAGTTLLDSDGELDPEPRPVFSETDWGGYRTVIDGDLKLVAQLEPEHFWFFDLATNPSELGGPLNPSDEPARDPRRRRLETLLDDWMATVSESEIAAATVDVSDEEREQLKALGYLD